MQIVGLGRVSGLPDPIASLAQRDGQFDPMHMVMVLACAGHHPPARLTRCPAWVNQAITRSTWSP